MSVDDLIEKQGFGRYQLQVFILVLWWFGLVGCFVTCDALFLMERLIHDVGISLSDFTASVSLFFGGWAIGAPVASWGADNMGRRPILVCPPFVMIASYLVFCLAGSVTVARLWAFRFVMGMIYGGVSAVAYTVLIEGMPSYWRGTVTVLINLSWAPFQILLVIVSYSMRNVSCTSQMLIVELLPIIGYSFFAVMFVRESPRWVANHVGEDEGRLILESVDPITYKHPPPLQADVKKPRVDGAIPNSGSKSAESVSFAPYAALCSKGLLHPTLIMCFVWFATTLVYYGLGGQAGSLAGDLYTNFARLAVVEVPGSVFPYLTMDKHTIGRRGTLALSLGFAGAVLLLAAASNIPPCLQTFLAICGKCGAASAFVAVYTYTGELFPTTCRATGLGVCNFMARIGGVIAPLLINLSLGTAIVFFGATSCAACFLVYLLPETLGRTLEDRLRVDEEVYGAT